MTKNSAQRVGQVGRAYPERQLLRSGSDGIPVEYRNGARDALSRVQHYTRRFALSIETEYSRHPQVNALRPGQ